MVMIDSLCLSASSATASFSPPFFPFLRCSCPLVLHRLGSAVKFILDVLGIKKRLARPAFADFSTRRGTRSTVGRTRVPFFTVF